MSSHCTPYENANKDHEDSLSGEIWKFHYPESKIRTFITSQSKLETGERKDNRFIEAFEMRLTQTEWGRLSGISVQALRYRLDIKRMLPEEALTTPDAKGNCYKRE